MGPENLDRGRLCAEVGLTWVVERVVPADEGSMRNSEEGGQWCVPPSSLPSEHCPTSDEGQGLGAYQDITFTDNLLLIK